jgi:hypothetical protein
MRLKFVIDREYDIAVALEINSGLNRGYLEDQYRQNLPEMLLKQKEYQKSWDEINDSFSAYVEEKTGYKWFYPEYVCVLSTANKGVSNWGREPKIIRSWQEDPRGMRRITAQELILSHYFEIYRRYYSGEGLTDGQVWALAEIAAFALTSLTKEVESFWPGDTAYCTNHNYPHIVKLQNDLRLPFVESLKKNDFSDYIKAGIKLVREYPDMGP